MQSEAEFLREVARSVTQANVPSDGCTCGVDEIAQFHPKSCALWNVPEWKEGSAEWDPQYGKLLYYHKDETGTWLTDFDQIWLDGDSFAAAYVDETEDDEESTELTCSCKPSKTWYCAVCGVQRSKETDPWEKIDFKAQSATNWDDWSTWSYSSCSHAMREVILPDGVRVYASGHHRTRAVDEKEPEFGIYLDRIWDPDCLSYFVPWNDHGLPFCSYEDAAFAIQTTYDYAKDGMVIEVGCIGGHGRTGTVLACWAILAGVKGKNAVKWVRRNYCDNAIESREQEWFPLWFEAWLNGTQAPPKPVWRPVVTSKSPSSSFSKNQSTTVSPITSPVAGQHLCNLCKEPMTLDPEFTAAKRYRCIQAECVTGRTNIAKEKLDEPVLSPIGHEIKECLRRGNWCKAGLFRIFLDETYAPWPGIQQIEDEFKQATFPITVEAAILRAMDRQGGPRLAEVVNE